MGKKTSMPSFFGRDDLIKVSEARSSNRKPLAPRGSYWLDHSEIRYIDLFCGIGGFHLAADDLGLSCVMACDIDAECRKAYKRNFGLEPKGDIASVPSDEIPDHDILFAGFPCQPFSIIGNRAGFDDVRGTLFFEVARILEAKQPKAFVLENVRQLKSHNKGKTLARILSVLDELGYHPFYDVLNALKFGLPQKRERIVIVGFKKEAGVDFKFPPATVPMKPLAEILEPKPDRKHFVSEHIRKARRDAHTSKHRPGIWHENKAGNISSHPYSCALRAGASYNYLLVDGKRRLTPKEMLRLQGFPDTYDIVSNDSQTRKQAGNSVPVPMIKAVLEKVLHAEGANQAQRKSRAA